jgi:HSP20 family protein
MMSRFLAPFQPSSSSRPLSGGDPFTELHQAMNRLFDDFVVAGVPQAQQGGGLMSVPRLDLRESEQEMSICAELPGVKPSDVDLRIEGNVITLRGEKKNEAEQDTEGYHVMERSFGRFQRSIQLPWAPDPEQVRAHFEHGVLTVHVPKQPQQDRSRRIQIQDAGASEEARVLNAPETSQQPGQAQGAPIDRTHH